MSPTKPPPTLPHGTSSPLSALSETFAFHSSPETFIANRIAQFSLSNPRLVSSRAVVRAKILGRDVAVVSQHGQIRQVLEASSDQFTAADAYAQFIGPFFPEPNLLLGDGERHGKMRRSWVSRLGGLGAGEGGRLGEVVGDVMGDWVAGFGVEGTDVNLYDAVKRLSWRLLLGLWLHLREEEEEFREIVRLQEELLRGQFSVFPVSVNVGFWHSPRKRGIDAKDRLEKVISALLVREASACPFAMEDVHDVARHFVLFTSSLAVKGVASLLTAYLLNIFLFARDGATNLSTEVQNLDPGARRALLRSILLETERLSPPIVGVMRRCQRETILTTPGESLPDVKIPKGWDVWLYFVAGGRDQCVFGDSFERFTPERFVGGRSEEGFGFGAGVKTCLGRDVVRDMCVDVVETILDSGISMEGRLEGLGTRIWLGWEEERGRMEQWRGIKQLPTQHPVEAVRVKVSRT